MISLTTIGLAVTLMLSSVTRVIFPEVSQSIGLSVASVFWIFVAMIGGKQPYTVRRSDARFAMATWAAAGLLIGHAIISNILIGGIDFGRLLVSAGILLVALMGANCAATQLLRIPPTVLARGTSILLSVLAMMGLAAAAGAPGLGSDYYAKSVVIYSEPSQFALAFLPLLLFRMAIAGRTTQLMLLAVALLIAALLQSLTMVAGILIIASVLLRSTRLLLILIPVAATGALLDLSYYADRLYLSSDSNNLSTLVFLQGWQNAGQNFSETHGFGVGFQQFGIAGSTSDITEKIAKLSSGGALNLLDGGTTASKLIGEFGTLGILLLATFVAKALRSISFIRAAQALAPAHRDVRRIFFCSIMVTYLFEIFIRGAGYFSPGSFLAVVALIGLARSGKADETRSEDAPAAANHGPSAAVSP